MADWWDAYSFSLLEAITLNLAVHNAEVPERPFQSWTSAPGRDSSLEYRLSVYHARKNDTGTYTCTTPYEQEHTIKIVVKEVRAMFYNNMVASYLMKKICVEILKGMGIADLF